MDYRVQNIYENIEWMNFRAKIFFSTFLFIKKDMDLPQSTLILDIWFPFCFQASCLRYDTDNLSTPRGWRVSKGWKFTEAIRAWPSLGSAWTEFNHTDRDSQNQRFQPSGKVWTFLETHEIRKNLPHGFDKSADLLSKRQNHEDDFFKLCVLLKKSELYLV